MPSRKAEALILHLSPPLPTVSLPADLAALLPGGHLLRGVEALVRHLSGVEEAAPTDGPTSCAASITLQTLTLNKLQGASGEHCALTALLLLRGEDADNGGGRGTSAGGQAAAGHAVLRSAASLVVALGKLLRRCEARLVAALGQCSCVQDAVEHPDWAMQVLFKVHHVACMGDGQELLVVGQAVGNGGAGEERKEEGDAADATVGMAADSGSVRCAAGGRQANQRSSGCWASCRARRGSGM